MCIQPLPFRKNGVVLIQLGSTSLIDSFPDSSGCATTTTGVLGSKNPYNHGQSTQYDAIRENAMSDFCVAVLDQRQIQIGQVALTFPIISVKRNVGRVSLAASARAFAV